MKIFVLLVTILFLTACHEQKEEVMDINELIPSSDRYAEGRTIEKEAAVRVNFFDSLSVNNKLLSDTLGIIAHSVEFLDTLWLPDRFDNVGFQKWTGETGQGTMTIAAYTYKDSMNLKNALFNWLDCFGKHCHSLQLFEEKKMNLPAFFIYTAGNTMVYVELEGLDAKKFLKNIESYFGRIEPRFVLSKTHRGITQWWGLVDKKWEIIKIEEK